MVLLFGQGSALKLISELIVVPAGCH